MNPLNQAHMFRCRPAQERADKDCHIQTTGAAGMLGEEASASWER